MEEVSIQISLREPGFSGTGLETPSSQLYTPSERAKVFKVGVKSKVCMSYYKFWFLVLLQKSHLSMQEEPMSLILACHVIYEARNTQDKQIQIRINLHAYQPALNDILEFIAWVSTHHHCQWQKTPVILVIAMTLSNMIVDGWKQKWQWFV